MKLIADSGSTKTDWVLCEHGKRVHSIQTQGINPFYQTTEEVQQILKTELLPHLGSNRPNFLYFYGAGCSFPDKQKLLRTAFENLWTHDLQIELNSDLAAAARALFRNAKGIACIIGTGSNSCLWDGKKITKNVPPLGYILGDEGSGAVLGKLLIADLLKNQLSTELSEKFYTKYKMSYEELMAIVYKHPFPNRNLAKFTYFLHENIGDKSIYSLVKNSFRAFVKRNLEQYPKELPVSFVGSIAVAFEPILTEVLTEKGFKKGKILKAPIDALEKFHA